MQSTQEIAELMLDSGRNALLTLDLKVSIATLGIGTGAMIAGVFGMNVGVIRKRQLIPAPILSRRTAIRILNRIRRGSRLSPLHHPLGQQDSASGQPGCAERPLPSSTADSGTSGLATRQLDYGYRQFRTTGMEAYTE